MLENDAITTGSVLHVILRLREVRMIEHGVERIFVGGLATDYCVKQTVLDGLSQGFKVMVIGDAVRGVDLNPNDSVQALKEMSEAGAVMLAGIENLHVTG